MGVLAPCEDHLRTPRIMLCYDEDSVITTFNDGSLTDLLYYKGTGDQRLASEALCSHNNKNMVHALFVSLNSGAPVVKESEGTPGHSSRKAA